MASFLRWHQRTAAGLLALGACTEDGASGEPAADGSMELARDASGPRDAGVASTLLRDSGLGVRPNPNTLEIDALRDEQVLTAAPARRVFYSWTTDEQATELRRMPTLLTRSARSDGTATKLSQTLATLAAQNDPLAVVLVGPDFQKGRFGWPSAWPTLRGWPGESYGTKLLRIVLKPEAWTARLYNGELHVFDAQNQRVDAQTVLRNPERIAAVYHVALQESWGGQCGSFVDCAPGAFREYFLNNERMVEEWSLGTQDILAEIERGRALVEQLLLHAETRFGYLADPCAFSGELLCAWSSPDSARSIYLVGAYLQSLAIASEYYQPNQTNLRALAEALAASRFELDPFVHRP